MLVGGVEARAPEGTAYRAWFLLNQEACPPASEIVNGFGPSNAQLTAGAEIEFVLGVSDPLYEGFLIEWYKTATGNVIQTFNVCYQYAT